MPLFLNTYPLHGPKGPGEIEAPDVGGEGRGGGPGRAGVAAEERAAEGRLATSLPSGTWAAPLRLQADRLPFSFWKVNAQKADVEKQLKDVAEARVRPRQPPWMRLRRLALMVSGLPA